MICDSSVRNWRDTVANLDLAREAPTAANVTVKAPRDYLTEREVEKLMDAAKANRWGHRDATAILLAYRHGLRASELMALRWDDIDFRTSKLHVRRAKGGTGSVHPLRAKELRAQAARCARCRKASGRPTSLCPSGWHRYRWPGISAWSREQERPQASASWSTATCCGTRPATSSPTMATTRARSRTTWAIGRLPRPCATLP